MRDGLHMVQDPRGYAVALVSITLLYQWPVVYLLGPRRWASNLAILVCLGLCLAYHLRHSGSRRDWGFSRRAFLPGLRPAAVLTAPAAVAFLLAGHHLESLRWRDDPLQSFAFLLIWALAQQLALHTVVLRFLERRSAAPARAAGLVFALLHLPNPFLVPLTFLAGWAWCSIYRKHPHLLPPALSHAALSFTILRKPGESGSLDPFLPILVPQFVVDDSVSVQPVLHTGAQDPDPSLVVLAHGTHMVLLRSVESVIGAGGGQGILAVGMAGVVHHLVFRSGMPDGLAAVLQHPKKTPLFPPGAIFHSKRRSKSSPSPSPWSRPSP